ncbi:MAG: hypothetical protein HY893_08515 [Deltaproteobacteria bacterium]|nr:hypothetical protein [Deltaproteobacteria bacterium]
MMEMHGGREARGLAVKSSSRPGPAVAGNGFLRSISGPDGKSGLFLFAAFFFAVTVVFYCVRAPGALAAGREDAAPGPSNGRSARMASSERELEGRMGSSSRDHFTVKYEGGENILTGYLIGMLLEEAYMKVGADLGFYPTDRIEALLYTADTFRDVTRSPSWAGAIYDGRIKLPAGGIHEKTEELEKVIFHEYTHAVVHRLSGGRAPVWLNEGMAQYEEGRSSSEYSELLRKIAEGNRVDLRVFERSFMGLNAAGASLAYLISLSATEYIIKEYGSTSLRRILEGLNGGMNMDAAVSSVLYISYSDLESGWLRSIKR